MKTTAALPGKLAVAGCCDCGAALPLVLLRLLRASPPTYRCTNAAACRKRQRQRRAVEEKAP